MGKSLLFLIFVAAVVLIFLIVATFDRTGPLDVVDGCSIAGAARGPEKAQDNELKNRYAIPQPGDFDTSVTLGTILQAVRPGDLDDRRAARVVGYVDEIVVGGVESCNCNATDAPHRDTHIQLVVNPHDGPRGVVVVEVTPRTRILAAREGLDWSTDALRRQFLGRRVQVEGWLYFDPDHVDQSFANDPDDTIGRSNWRGTSWEIHPVTNIELAIRGD